MLSRHTSGGVCSRLYTGHCLPHAAALRDLPLSTIVYYIHYIALSTTICYMYCIALSNVHCPVQELLVNKGKLDLESLLDACRHEPGADCKLLFIRAATAAGLRQCRHSLWSPIQCALEDEDKRCMLEPICPVCKAWCKCWS